jgi:hypothetical protein
MLFLPERVIAYHTSWSGDFTIRDHPFLLANFAYLAFHA